MIQAAGKPAVQELKPHRKTNRSSRADKSDRDLSAAGGEADQGRSKHPAVEKFQASSGAAAARPGSPGVDTLPTSGAGRGHSTVPSAASAPPAVSKQENPQRWAKALGSAAGAPPSASASMPPARKQPQQPTGSQAQDKGVRPAQPAPAAAAAGKGSAAGSSAAPTANGSGKGAGQQGGQQHTRPVRVTRTVSNSSNEATTPVHSSQTSSTAAAAGKQQPPQQPSGSAAPKTAGLSYAAAALHRQPPPAPAPAPAAARPKKPTPAPAAPQEPFPPLSSPNKPQVAAGGWAGGSAGTPTKPWGPNRQPEQANGKAEAPSSQPAKEAPAGTSAAAPAGQGKQAPPAANGPSKVSAQAVGSSAAPPPVATVSRQDSFGRGGGRGRGGRGSSGGGSSQWAPKQAQPAAPEQQPVDPWTSKAAAYADDMATKSSTPKAAAAAAAIAAAQQQAQPQQGGKAAGAKDSSGSGKEGAAQPKGGSTVPQAASQQVPRKPADKGPSSPKGAQHPGSKAPAAAPQAPAAQQVLTPAAPSAAQQQVQVQEQPQHKPAATPALQAPAVQQGPPAPKAQGAAAVPASTPAAAPGFGAVSQQVSAPSNFGSDSTGSAPHANAPAPAAAASNAAPSAVAPASSSLPPKTEVPQAAKQPVKQPQQQHSPAFKLPSSQAVNMAAVAARSHGSEDSRLGGHGYGNMDAFGVTSAYQAMGSAAYQASSMQAAAALNSFMPRYPQAGAGQLPTGMGPVDFLLGPAGGSNAFRDASFVTPDVSMGSQQYGSMVGSGIGSSMAGPQAPPMPSSALHAAAGGPSSTGSRSGGSAAPRVSGSGSGGSTSAMKRHLSADAPPFEVPARTSGGASAGPGSSAEGTAGGQRSGGSTRGAGGSSRGAAGSGGSSGSGSAFSRQLFELAEQMQAEEAAREADRADAAKQIKELQDKLAAEKAGRAAAEARTSGLEQDLAASHRRNKDLEQQLNAESSLVAQLRADVASKVAEADDAISRTAGLEVELHSTKQQLDDAQARIASLQQQCQALEAEKLQLQQDLNTHTAHVARQVAGAAVAAAGLHGSGLQGLGLGGPHSHGGIAARLPPPGFDPVPLHHQQQQHPAPVTPSAVSGPMAPAAAVAAGPPQPELAGDGMPVEMNEHQLVLAFLSLLSAEPSQGLRFTEQSETEVNVKLMPLTWDEHYQYKYGTMVKFMMDRPMVFQWRDDGAFYKYHNSEELVRNKMAEEAAAAAASSAQPVPAPAPVDNGIQGGSFAPAQPQQQPPQGPPSGGWHGQFPGPQQHMSAPMQGQHSMHSGPPSGHGMNMHVPPAHQGGPIPPHMGSMGVSVGMPHYPHHMMQNAPASMPLAAPSMPFHSGQQGW